METTAPKAFIQVFIKSAEDLPKENGYYTTHNKVVSEWITGYDYYSKKDNADDSYWLFHFDWYLEPVESHPVSYGREEIIKAFEWFNVNQWRDSSIKHLFVKCDYIKLTDEYFESLATELSEVKESGNVTDEEIEKEAFNYCASPDGQGGADFDAKAHSYFIDGAKWLRSRLQPAIAYNIGLQSYFMRVRELTDEEWLVMPKEEILKLYKNCYSTLMNYVQQPAITDERAELMEKYGVTEEMVTEYLKQFEAKPLTDEQIEKWIENHFISTDFDDRHNPTEVAKSFVKDGMRVVLKAMQSGKIAEWVKNQK